MIRVLLADDHTVIRDALRYLLEAQGDIEVVAMASDGQDAVDKAQRECPDVVVMDISMPRMDGITATKQLCEYCPDTRVVMLTIYQTVEHVQRALQAGAHGYVLKDSAGQELVEAVRTLHQGGNYFSSSVSEIGNRLIRH
jgi:DNA-binding NarL/FixJ family response regulator